jgi:hypothetical protein
MGDSVGGSSGEAIDGKYSHLVFIRSEEGSLPPTELNRAYERPGKFSINDGMISTEPFTSPREAIKRMKIYMDNQRIDNQMKEINEAITCLRYLFGKT